MSNPSQPQESSLSKPDAASPDGNDKVLVSEKKSTFLVPNNTNTTQGRNVSGRSWKAGRVAKRASSLQHTRHNNRTSSWDKKQQWKLRRQQTIQLHSELSGQRKEEKLQKRERRLENERRRMEREYQQAQQSAQTLNYNKLNTTLKTMSKKQLRQVKKTRLNTKTGVVEYVPAYTK